MSLPPDPALVAHVAEYKAATSWTRAIPSACDECGGEFPSRTSRDAHVRVKHPKEPAFNDELREEFLQLLRNGGMPNKSARSLGVSPYTVKKARQLDPSFAEAMDLAEEEAAEDIEEVLRERAVAADPWAVKQWLTKRSQSRWSDDKTININVQGEFNHRLDLLPHEKDILALQQTVRERAALNGTQLASDNSQIIDAEIVE